MNFKQKFFLSLNFLFLFFLINCGDDSAANQKTITVNEWSLLDTEYFGDRTNAGNIALARDESAVYFTTNSGTELYRYDGSSVSTLDFKYDYFSGSTDAGKASLTDATKVSHIEPAHDGVIVSLELSSAAKGGVAYVSGEKFSAAWVNNATHFTNANVTRNENVFATAYSTSATDEWLLVAPANGGVAAQGNLKVAALPNRTEQNGANFLAVNGFANINRHLVIVAGANLYYGGDSYKEKSNRSAHGVEGTTVENDTVTKVDGNSGNVYIAFQSNGSDNKGGVAVVELNTPGDNVVTYRPASEWNHLTVVDLAYDGSKWWAILKDDIIEIKLVDDGTNQFVRMGEKFLSDTVAKNKADTSYNKAKDGYSGKFPTSITGAKVLDGQWVITSDDGVYVLINDKKMNITK